MVDDPAAVPALRKFSLPPPHAEVLADPDSLDYLAPLAQMFIGVLFPIPGLIDAYRTGGRVPYGDYGVDLREGQGAINRSAFLFQLGSEWLPSIVDVHQKLGSQAVTKVADIGRGVDWSSIGIAKAYENLAVDGLDLAQPSIEDALKNAVKAGVSDRVNFYARDAGEPELRGNYDLVTAFECIHDLADPVSVLQAMRGLLKDDGCVVMADERTGKSFMSEDGDVDWMMYGWSFLHCLPVGMADQPSVETGTVMRQETMARYAEDAGFRSTEVLPIENFLFRFYRLNP